MPPRPATLADPDLRHATGALLLFGALRAQQFAPERAAELVRQALAPNEAELEQARAGVKAWLELGARHES